MAKKAFLWLGYFVVAVFVCYIGLQYFWYDPRSAGIVAGKLQQVNFPFRAWEIFFYFHIITGAIALIAGPFQFRKLSQGNIRIHRTIGKVYVSSIFLSVPAGIYLSFYATGGVGSTIGFLILNTAWFTTTFIGLQRIRRRNIRSHQEWMLRSYWVTLVFVTFRMLMPIFTFVFGLDVTMSFPLAIYLGIVINLSIVEVYLRRKRKALIPAGRSGFKV